MDDEFVHDVRALARVLAPGDTRESVGVDPLTWSGACMRWSSDWTVPSPDQARPDPVSGEIDWR